MNVTMYRGYILIRAYTEFGLEASTDYWQVWAKEAPLNQHSPGQLEAWELLGSYYTLEGTMNIIDSWLSTP